MKKNSKLLSYEDSLKLNISEVKDYYKKFINKSQVDFFSSFGFGNDLISNATNNSLTTQQGEKILDFTGGIGVLNTGHNNDKIIKKRITFQQEKRMEVHKIFFSQYLAALSYNMSIIFPNDLNKSFFPNSGAEAIEAGVKLAFKYHNGLRKSIVHSDISFHGKTLAALNISNSTEINFGYQKILDNFIFEYNNFDSLQKLIEDLKKSNNLPYCLVVEPFSASTLRESDIDFLEKTQKICNNNKIVLVFDEIYSGWAKTGKLFNFFRSNAIPDIVAYSKSFGGGKASISGITVRDKIYKEAYENSVDFSLLSSTFNGFGEECITALETTKIIVEENYEDKSITLGKKILELLTELHSDNQNIIRELRGSGALWGIIFKPFWSNKIISILSKFIPLKVLKTDNFINKLYCAAVIDKIYCNYKILLFGSLGSEIILKIAPSIITSDDELKKLRLALSNVLKINKNKLMLDFAQNKLIRSFK